MVRTGTRLWDESVYVAASRFRDAGTRARQSVFAPPRPAWSLASFQDLEGEFASEPDTSGGSFEEKLRSQLRRCSDHARLLVYASDRQRPSATLHMAGGRRVTVAHLNIAVPIAEVDTQVRALASQFRP